MKNQFKIKGLGALLILGMIWFASSACFPIATPPAPIPVDCPPGAPPTDPCQQPR